MKIILFGATGTSVCNGVFLTQVMSRPFIFAGLLAAAAIGCARTVEVRPLNSIDALVGSWRVIDYVVWDSAGVEQRPMGSPPSGYASFDPAGFASIQLGRAIDASSFVGYFGTYTVAPTQDTLKITVEGGTIRTYAGSVQVRPFKIRADTLRLGVRGRYEATLVRIPQTATGSPKIRR